MNLAWMAACVLVVGSPAWGWDAPGHKMITKVALERSLAGPDAPAMLKDEATRQAILTQASDQAATPDRWRSMKVPQLAHVNAPDHYLDVEGLGPLGMTLRTMPPLRYEFVKATAFARAQPGFKGEPINPAADPSKIQEYPGFLPYAIVENYGKLISAFRQWRLSEHLMRSSKDAREKAYREQQMALARQNAITTLGVLSHFVGDAAQPLHTTHHHHGWVGENPKGYTTDRKIHAYIDGEILKIHAITERDIAGAIATRATPSAPTIPEPRDAWTPTLDHIERSFQKVEPLYQSKRSGELEKAPGKALITERLGDGAWMLSELIDAAWKASAFDDKDLQDFLKYDDAIPASFQAK